MCPRKSSPRLPRDSNSRSRVYNAKKFVRLGRCLLYPTGPCRDAERMKRAGSRTFVLVRTEVCLDGDIIRVETSGKRARAAEWGRRTISEGNTRSACRAWQRPE